jgi:hypothetical protein
MPTILKPRTTSIIPRGDEDLNKFAAVFEVTLQDASYSLPIGTKAALAAIRITFSSDLFRISRPQFNTPNNIQLKNDSGTELLRQLRTAIKKIKNNFRSGLVTQGQMLNVGIPVPKQTSTPEPAPTFAPGLVIESQTAHTATLKLIQSTNRGSNTNTRLPKGVTNVQLLQKTNDNGLHLIRSFTRPTVKMNLEPFAPGSDIVVAVRYLGSRQEPGPLSQSLTIHIPA